MGKKTKRMFLLAMTAALLLVLPAPMKALAAGNTYIVRYDEENGKWYYQNGNTWNEDGEKRELYYLEQDLQNGDIIVVDSSGEIRLNVHLSNLTLSPGVSAIVTTNGIDDCFLTRGTVSAINGDVANAYVYEDAAVTFNNSVGNLNVLAESDLMADVTVAGTVGRVIGDVPEGEHYEYQGVAKGKLVIEDGSMKTAESDLNTAVPAAPKTPTQQSTAPAQQSSSAGEYDDVPKTGESQAVYWLLAVAAVCLAGRYALKKV